MDTNLLMSDLYQQGYINGKSFFYCVEHNINTVEDLQSYGQEELPDFCREELSALLSSNESGDTDYPSESFDGPNNVIHCKYILDYFEKRLLETGPRVQRLFSAIRSQHDDVSYLQALLSISEPSDFPEVYHIGEGTIQRALRLLKDFQAFASSYRVTTIELPELDDIHQSVNAIKPEDKDSTAIIDSLEPTVRLQMQSLTVRSRNIMGDLFRYSGGTVSSFYTAVTDPSFRVEELRNAGRKSWGELKNFISWLRTTVESSLGSKEMLSEITDETSALMDQIRWKQLGINDDLISELLCKHKELGRAPFFAAIHHYILSQEEKKKTIIQSLLLIYDGQETLNRNDVAKQLSLTSERVRQLANTLLHNHIETFVLQLKEIWSDNTYEYDYRSPDRINIEEGTCFSRSFIFWIISLLDDSYTIVGNIDHCFLNYHNQKPQLYLVPTALNKVFDFDRFIYIFDQIYHEKHTSDYECNISDICFRCFNGRVMFENLEEIIIICRNIIELFYTCYFRNGNAIIEQNAQMLVGDIVVSFIEESGRPLSADELFNAISERYPGRVSTIQSLIPYIQKDERLRPMGRSGIYTLKEWGKEEHRGGTIREFAFEYLSDLSVPIATLEELGEYIRKYRPDSSNSSIKGNLLAESSGRYSMFYKDNECYIGLSSYDYDPSFIPYTKESGKRDFKVSCTLLEQFLVSNNHFPFMNDENEDETRLYRFWSIQKSRLNKGEIGEDEAATIQSILTRFDALPKTKSEFLWIEKFNIIISEINKSKNSLWDLDVRWISDVIGEYEMGTLDEWKKSKVELLINTLKDAKRV